MTAFRYQQLAGELEKKIIGGQYRVGERLPSLRRLHVQTGLSITTVSQAYAELERRGVVEPREKSGFFVRPVGRAVLPVPQQISKERTEPQRVAVNALAESVLSTMHDPQVIPFGAAVPAAELLPHRQLARAMRTLAPTYFRDAAGFNYGPADGEPGLKRLLASRMIGLGQDVSSDQLIVTNGCLDAIQLSLQAVAQPGDIIITESPTFTCYLQLIEELGLLALEIPASAETGLDLDVLEDCLFDAAWRGNRVAACLFNPSFQNPLGSVMPEAHKQRLVDMLAVLDIPLIEDDLYGDLQFGSVRPTPLKCYDEKGLVLYCSSFSKTLAPDLRVGWLLPGRFYEKVRQFKFHSSIASSKLPQLLVSQFLATGDYDRHLRKLRRALQGQVSLTSEAIARYFPAGTKLTAPQGGYILWVELDSALDGLQLYHLARQEHIFIIPGVITSCTGKFKHCIRISCGTPWSPRLEEGIARLGELVQRCLA